MIAAIDIVATVLTALVMAPALAHARELPGKRRLGHDAYRQVQKIVGLGKAVVGP